MKELQKQSRTYRGIDLKRLALLLIELRKREGFECAHVTVTGATWTVVDLLETPEKLPAEQ